jgi:hypothetical protein
MKFTILILLPFLLLACKKPVETSSSESHSSSGCYIFLQDGSEVSMQISTDDQKISGTLTYAFKEKDKNTGSISGEMKGDTLFAKYTYMSEGITGERDEVFLKSGESFIVGRGGINDQTGEPDLSDRSKINFTNGLILKKTDCEKIK